MNNQKSNHWNRREFLTNLAVAGSAALLGLHADAFAAEPPLETTRIRIPQIPSTCRSPEWIAEELLRAEGFTDVQYIPVPGTQGVERTLASGETDIGGHFAAPVILRLEDGDPVVIVGGEHIGCFELLGSERIRTIRDLKGRSVAIPELDPSPYAFLASMVSYVGLNPSRRHRQVLVAPTARSRHDQVEPAEDSCPRNGLAVSARAEERTENVDS